MDDIGIIVPSVFARSRNRFLFYEAAIRASMFSDTINTGRLFDYNPIPIHMVADFRSAAFRANTAYEVVTFCRNGVSVFGRAAAGRGTDIYVIPFSGASRLRGIRECIAMRHFCNGALFLVAAMLTNALFLAFGLTSRGSDRRPFAVQMSGRRNNIPVFRRVAVRAFVKVVAFRRASCRNVFFHDIVVRSFCDRSLVLCLTARTRSDFLAFCLTGRPLRYGIVLIVMAERRRFVVSIGISANRTTMLNVPTGGTSCGNGRIGILVAESGNAFGISMVADRAGIGPYARFRTSSGFRDRSRITMLMRHHSSAVHAYTVLIGMPLCGDRFGITMRRVVFTSIGADPRFRTGRLLRYA